MSADDSDRHFARWQSSRSTPDWGWLTAEIFEGTQRVCIRAADKQIILDFETAAALVQFLASRVSGEQR